MKRGRSDIVTSVIYLLPPAIVICIMRSICIEALPKWDGADYFNALLAAVHNSGTRITVESFVRDFSLCGHNSIGYAIVLSVGQFIDTGNVVLLSGTTIVLTLIMLYCMHMVVLKLFHNAHPAEAAIIACIVGIHPVITGSALNCYPDFATLVFFVMCACALLYKKKLLFCVSGIILVFSKEPGVLLYLSITAALGIVLLIDVIAYQTGRKTSSFIDSVGVIESGPLKRTGAAIDLASFIKRNAAAIVAIIMPLLLFWIYRSLRNNELWQGGGSTFTWNNSGLHCFGFNLSFIATRFKSVFLQSFNWVFSIFIAVNLFKYVLMLRAIRKDTDVRPFMFITLPAAIFLFFLFLFITFNHHRYMLPFFFPFVVMFYASIQNLMKNKVIRILSLAAVCLLLIIQNFKSIDPVSKYIFGTLQFGKHEMTYGKGDMLVYSLEYSVIDRLVNKFLQEIQVRPDTTIVVYDNTFASFLGGNGRGRDDIGIQYDAHGKKRTYRSGNSFPLNIVPLNKFSATNVMGDHVYFATAPWDQYSGNEAYSVSVLSAHFRVQPTTIVEHNGYQMKYFKVKKK